VTLSKGSETMEPVAAEYFNWEPDGAQISIHMHLDAVDGIARDVIEGLKTLPRRGLEVGGLLLGHVKRNGDQPNIWIERYQRIPCAHRFGPQFVLDQEDQAAMEDAAADVTEKGELSIVGLYRSNTRPNFQLEEPDFELISRYFTDPNDLILLINPESLFEISAQFYVRAPGGRVQPLGDVFPFRGRALSIISDAEDELVETELAPEPVNVAEPSGPALLREEPVLKEQLPERSRFEEAPREREQPAAISEAPVAVHEQPMERPLEPFMRPKPEHEITPQAPERARRFVADFAPDPADRPMRPLEPRLMPPFAPHNLMDPEPVRSEGHIRKWLPFAGALLLGAGAFWLLVQPGRHETATSGAPVPVSEGARPLGLYIDSGGPVWRISWNPNATALHGARSVQLFVREGEDQNRIELSPADLSTGTYEYRPTGNDVTFRLEVTEGSGRVSAESFRFSRAPATLTGAAPGGSPSPGSGASTALGPAPVAPKQAASPRTTPPRAIHKIAPSVPSSIRPRINGKISIDVLVRVDTHGKVLSAVPVGRPQSGLQTYLAGRAVAAARQWRFEPAHEADGTPVQGNSTIHFDFEK
jgi:hypothetical protein